MATLAFPNEAAEDISSATVRRFTVEEYHQLIGAGILDDDDGVELLEGYIVKKMSKDPLHDAVLTLIATLLTKKLPPGWHVRTQCASTTADSEPEPDIVIARGEVRDYMDRHPAPADIALVVEIANSSLHRDRGWKRRIYGGALVPQYWVVDVRALKIEVYTDPTAQEADLGYRSMTTLGKGQTLDIPLDDQKLSVAVSDLLP